MMSEDDQWTQFGLFSFGSDQCAPSGDYGVYTRVSMYRDWIDSYIETNNDEPEHAVLTDDSLYVIQPGTKKTVYGSYGENNILVKNGANAKLLNFVGNNFIYLELGYTQFSVSRSGAMVTFQATDGTVFVITATATAQTIIFTDQSLDLVIDSGKVFLGRKEIMPMGVAQ